jgi:hypothetical protein
MKYNLDFILNNVVFACAWGSYVIAERSTLEGVHAVLCAKEIFNLLNSGSLTLEIAGREHFDSGQNLPTKMLLLLRYIMREDHPMTGHFWPYGSENAIIFKNWK